MDKEKVKEISLQYKVSISNAEVIQLAKEINTQILLADEEEVREAAEIAGFKVKGCLGILMEAAKNEILSPQQVIQGVDSLVKSGYRISNDIIRAVKNTLKRWDK